jgi:hypothetical protein
MLRPTAGTGSALANHATPDGSRATTSHPIQRLSARAVGSGAITRLDLDAAFFWLLLVFLVTVVSFLNLRGSHVELNPSQIAEYERRTQVLANSTVYIVEVHRPEGLLSKLKPEDWDRVSKAVDFVAFVFDDLAAFLSDDWIARAETVLRDQSLPHGMRVQQGLGILLFQCGCIIPNAYFRKVAPRLGGMECILLPGWVLPHQDVHWMPDIETEPKMQCKRQRRMAASQVVREYASELVAIRRAVEKIRADLPVPAVANNSNSVIGAAAA